MGPFLHYEQAERWNGSEGYNMRTGKYRVIPGLCRDYNTATFLAVEDVSSAVAAEKKLIRLSPICTSIMFQTLCKGWLWE